MWLKSRFSSLPVEETVTTPRQHDESVQKPDRKLEPNSNAAIGQTVRTIGDSSSSLYWLCGKMEWDRRDIEM